MCAGNETLACADEATGAPCERWVEARLLAPPSGHWLARLASKLLLQVSTRVTRPFLALPLPFCQRLMPLLAVLQQPIPIEAGDDGPHRRVHCFGP